MEKRVCIIILVISTFLLNACQKSIDAFVPDPNGNAPDTNWYNSITAAMPVIALQNDLALKTTADSFIVNNNAAVITASNGLEIRLPANGFVNSAGQAITGKVNVATLLLKSKGDMVLMNKPTSSNGQLLVSGGVIFLGLTQNGQQIALAPNTEILFRYTDAGPNRQMKLFYGDETNPQQFNWVPAINVRDSVFAGSQYYEIIARKLRWLNCDYFYDTLGTVQSTVSVQLPFNYTNANTETFIIFKNIRSVIGMIADVADKKFISTKMPGNLAATVVAISKQGNDYFLGKEQITTGTNVNAGNQKVSITPVKISLADIKAYLATL
jgi:hypothetical protein